MNRLLDTSFKYSLIRNSLVQLIWWSIFSPGFYSTDSFAVLQMAKTGDLSGSWSAPWALTVTLLSFGGLYPGLVTLFLSQIFSISITIFTYSFLSSKRSALISVFLHLTPLIGAIGVTLWHDIPMTAGFFLVSAFCLRAQKLGTITMSEVLKLLIPGMALATFRGNGLPTTLIFLILFMIIEKKVKKKKLILAGIIFSIIFNLVSESQMTTKGLSNFEFATDWIIFDISCYSSTDKGRGFVERNIPGVGNTDSWSSASACVWFSDAKLSPSEITKIRTALPGLLIKLAKEDFGFLLSTHLQRHKYLIPVPIYGTPSIPFIHSTIEFANEGVKWNFQEVAEKARSYVRVWNYFNFFFAYAGLWFIIICLVALIQKRRDLLHLAALSLVLMTSLFIFAGISDARYTLYVLIVGQMIGLNIFINLIQTLLFRIHRSRISE